MKWIKSNLFLLVLVLASLPCYSLSPEEEAELSNLSKEDLIKIVKIYDNSLTQIEEEMRIQNQIWLDKEIILNERENYITREETRLNEWEVSLNLRENLLDESYEIQVQMMKDKFWSGFGWGFGSGFVGGGVGGYLVGQR